jgi:hypothetical protein
VLILSKYAPKTHVASYAIIIIELRIERAAFLFGENIMTTKKTVKKRAPNKGGQPTKYRPEYCQQLIDYFSIDPTKITEDETISSVDGDKLIARRMPQRMPWLEGFARKIGVHRNTLRDWCDLHPEFAEAYETAKDLQREFIVDVALSGAAPPSFAIFTMKNVCGWRDERDLKLKKAKEEGNIDDEELRAAIFE